jgi:TRAP-type mannitol/chloroaromatic compound transport system substrate-binding protein
MSKYLKTNLTMETEMKYKKMTSTLLFIGLVLIYSNTAIAKNYKWRAVSHQLVGTARFVGTVEPFCECVDESSDGRLKIEPYGAGVLFPVSSSLDAVRDGLVQMGMVWSGYWAGKNPVFALAGSRPGDPIKTFSESFYRADKLKEVVDKSYAKFGVKSLGAFDYAPPEILCSVKPINTMADFKGKTIRSGGLGASFYHALGASAVTLTGAEIYQGLQLGTIDGAEYNDWLVNKEMGFHEVTKYVIEPVLHTGSTDDKELIVNPAAWKSLPKDLQSIVLSCRDRARYLSAVAYEIDGEKAKQDWLKAGVEIITLPDADVLEARKRAAKLIVDFGKKSPEAAEYVKVYGQTLKELGYVEEAAALGTK